MTMQYRRGDERKASDEVQRRFVLTRRPVDHDLREARWHEAQSAGVQSIGGKRRKGDVA